MHNYCNVFTFAFKEIDGKKYIFILIIPAESNEWKISAKKINDKLQPDCEKIEFDLVINLGIQHEKNDKNSNKPVKIEIKVNKFILSDDYKLDLGNFITDHWQTEEIDKFLVKEDQIHEGVTCKKYDLTIDKFKRKYIKNKIETFTFSKKQSLIILIIAICFVFLLLYLYFNMNEIDV